MTYHIQRQKIEQCKHCLAATNLGKQYVFVSDLAISQLKIVERVYLADNEKNYYKEMRSSDSKLGEDKVKLARIQYRGKGSFPRFVAARQCLHCSSVISP